jgi:hypothetical protein
MTWYSPRIMMHTLIGPQLASATLAYVVRMPELERAELEGAARGVVGPDMDTICAGG